MSDKRRAVKQRLRDAGESGDWPDEPEEFDPTSLGPDPVSPSSGDPETATGAAADAFWSAVVLANVGLFAVCIGPMLAYFQGRVALGGAVFAVGAVALVRTYLIYDRATGDDEADGGVEA